MLGLFLFVIISRLLATLAHPIEVGIDSAYYTTNVLSLLTGGFLYYDAPILSFAVAAFFSVLLGGNVIVGVKIASAFFAGLLSVGLFYAAFTLTKGDWRAGLIAGLLVAIDVSMFEISTSLLKNEAALAFLPLAIAFLYRYLEMGHKIGDLFLFFITGLLTVLSHLVTVAWLFATVIAFIGYEVISHLKQHQGGKVFRKLILPIGITGLGFLLVYLLFDFLIPAGNTWYTSSSLLKAANYFTTMESIEMILNIFAFTAPLIPEAPNLFELSRIAYTTVIVLLSLLSLLFLFSRNKREDRMVLTLFIVNILMGIVMGGWLIRFQIMCFIPLWLILGMGLIPLLDSASTVLGSLISSIGNRQKRIRLVRITITISLVIGLTGLAIPNYYWAATKKIHPYITQEELESIEALRGQFPEDVKLYAPQGVNYFITSRTGYESPPDWGDSAWPVFCAHKMFYDLKIYGRPSYYVINSTHPLLNEFNQARNQYVNIDSVRNFDLIKTYLNVTVTTDKPVLSLYCHLRRANDASLGLTVTFRKTRDDSWYTSISLEKLPDGLYEVYVSPRIVSNATLELHQYWFGFHIYHFKDLSEPRISLKNLIYQINETDAFHIFGVNESTATRISLLTLDVRPSMSNEQSTPLEPYMLPITPAFFLPYQLLPQSTFILILLLCPMNAIYFVILIEIICKGVKHGSLSLHKLLSITSSVKRSPQKPPHPPELYMHKVL